MLLDGITLLEGSEIANLTVSTGASFPDDANTGELFYKTGVGLHVYSGTAWELLDTGTGITDHGALDGLGDDDHTLYALADGTRGSFASVAALNLKANIASPTFTGTVGGIDKSMVGLGNVDNTSDANKPVSTATQTALNLKQNSIGFTPENAANKGVAGGYASLDGAGLVPSTQLPSYVDDVLEYANLAGFPMSGETGKIYVDISTNKTYRWSGTVYVYITSGAVDSVAGKTGVVTLVKSDVGLGNVDNTSDADKPVSTATQTALNLKANLASPALTGIPTAPTADASTNTTQIATTAYVKAQGYTTSSGVTSVSGTAPVVSSGGATPAISMAAATTSVNGYMTSAYATKLDGIAAGAQVNVNTNLGQGAITTTTIPLTSSTGTGTTLPAATTSLAGLMTSTDKTKLDGIASGANSYSLPVATSAILGGVKDGTGLTIAIDGTASVDYGTAAGTAVQGNDTRVTADQAAATASIRTLGTNATQAAAGNHTHGSFNNSTALTGASVYSVVTTSNGIVTGLTTRNLTAANVGAVATNTAITAGTATKITYDAKGLVTVGASLVAADIPSLDAAKITTGTFTDATMPSTMANKVITGLKETRVAMGANDISIIAGNVFTKTISGTTTLTVSNVPAAGTVASFILDLTNGGSAAITWWSGMEWAGGTAPTLTAAGRDVLGFLTHDGGTTWNGLVLGKDVK